MFKSDSSHGKNIPLVWVAYHFRLQYESDNTGYAVENFQYYSWACVRPPDSTDFHAPKIPVHKVD